MKQAPCPMNTGWIIRTQNQLYLHKEHPYYKYPPTLLPWNILSHFSNSLQLGGSFNGFINLQQTSSINLSSLAMHSCYFTILNSQRKGVPGWCCDWPPPAFSNYYHLWMLAFTKEGNEQLNLSHVKVQFKKRNNTTKQQKKNKTKPQQFRKVQFSWLLQGEASLLKPNCFEFSISYSSDLTILISV